jgi:DNA invertase Pin-like site-specific DNA recombinase
MEKIITAAGYIRVSTAEQALKGLSIETQMAEIESYAKSKNMKLAGFYIDKGITARKSLHKRVDFMRMMGDVESGKIKHIIVLRLDRFFRNIYDYHRMMNEYLTPNKCDWSAVKEQYTTSTTNGRLMINLRLSIAEQECDTDSDRIIDVFDNRVKNGFAITGAQPFGFTIKDKRVVIDEEKRAIMEDMLNYVELSSSVRGTLTYMKNTYNISFCYESLSRLLKNPMLYGSYRGNDNYCEGYMTKERFENMRRLLDKNIRQRKNNYSYIFSGLIICNECDYHMTGVHSISNKYSYSYYRCTNHYGNRRCDNVGQINEVYIENYLLENIKNLIDAYICEVEKIRENSKPIKSNRKAIEKKLQKLNDLYVNEFIDMDKYKKEYDLLQSQIIDTPDEPKKDLKRLEAFLEGDFSNIYENLKIEEKRALWRSIIKEIKIYKKEIVDVVFL